MFDATHATGREGAVAADAAHRLQEYNPHDTPQYGPGEGRQHLAFLVETLKPYVDQRYRTRPGRHYTALAGSSTGGLLTFYGGLYYPAVFGSLGVFSPSFWLAPDLAAEIGRVAPPARAANATTSTRVSKRCGSHRPPPINMDADMRAAVVALQAGKA